MKFAFLSLDFRRFPLEYAFRCANRYGFDGIEIWGGRPHAYPDDLDDEMIRNVLRWKKEYRLEVPMFTPDALNQNRRLTVCDPKERADSMRFLKKAVDAASAFECPRVLTLADHPGYTESWEDAWNIFCENVEELVDYAAPKGVRITIEPLTPMESPIIARTDDCVRLMDAVKRESLHFMMDVVPPRIGYEPYSNYFSKLGSRMDYIHICNNDGVTDAHTRLENGVLPVEDMLCLFKNWNYQGYVSAELYSECYYEPELMLANTARVISDIRTKLGI